MTGSAAEVPELPAQSDVRPPGPASRPPDGRPSPTLCGRPVPTDRALVMAIVNRTPDSFYDRGATFTDAAALAAVDRAVTEGADLVDIGGVKAGPGDLVDSAEEIRRVVPFVAAIRERYPDLLISVDTWRSEVARRAVAAGADLINDTWAGADPELVDVAAEFGAGMVCSHTGGAIPRTRPHRVRYADIVVRSCSPRSSEPPRTLRGEVSRRTRSSSIRPMISARTPTTGSSCCGTWTFS